MDPFSAKPFPAGRLLLSVRDQEYEHPKFTTPTGAPGPGPDTRSKRLFGLGPLIRTDARGRRFYCHHDCLLLRTHDGAALH